VARYGRPKTATALVHQNVVVSDRPRHLYSPGARRLGAGIMAIFMIGTGAGMINPVNDPADRQWAAGLIPLVLEAALLSRSLRLGLTIYPDRVVSRGWLRTRTFPRDAITGAGMVGYSGIYNRYTTSGLLVMLTLNANGHTVSLPHVAGRVVPTRLLAVQLHEALGIPTASVEVGRHRT
jgi:hypothetical protein